MDDARLPTAIAWAIGLIALLDIAVLNTRAALLLVLLAPGIAAIAVGVRLSPETHERMRRTDSPAILPLLGAVSLSALKGAFVAFGALWAVAGLVGLLVR